jgi:glycosyltransferase involved in cell wall biosynthesis
MNILIITVVGGFLPKFLMQDVQMLMERGHVVHYATNFENPIYECNKTQLEESGIKCFQIPIAKSPLAFRANDRALKELREIVKNCLIDMVYMHNPVGGVLGRLLSRDDKDLITVYTAHGFHFYQGAPMLNWLLYYPVERILAKRTDILVTINHEDEERAKKFKLRKNGCVKRIPSIGLDPERFYQDIAQREPLRAKFGVASDEFLFLSVGELIDNKNHATIIKAFARANLENSRLFICGEGSKRRKLQKLIERLGLVGKVVLCGYQSRIEDFYRMADVFLFPSFREGMGMAALEAMACGLPIIVSDNRGSREYSRENAIVCDALKVEEFASAMKKIYSEGDLRRYMAQQSLSIVPDFYKEKTCLVMQKIIERLETMHE